MLAKSPFVFLIASCTLLPMTLVLYGENKKSESEAPSEFLIKRIGRKGATTDHHTVREAPPLQEQYDTENLAQVDDGQSNPPIEVEERVEIDDEGEVEDEVKIEIEEERPSFIYQPPSSIQPTKTWGVFITGDFLWWSAHEEGLSFASTGFNSNPTAALTQASVPRGQVQNFPGKWGPGFRLGLGAALDGIKWDLYLNWTRFYQENSKGISSNPNNVFSNGSPLYDEWGEPSVVFGSPFSSINASWHLHYNTLDLELGRKFTPHEFFSVRPFVGIRGALILQSLHIDEQQNNPLVTPIDPIIYIRNQNNYRGIGLRTGVHIGLDFCHDWEFFGNFAAALLSGKFSILNHQQTTEVGIPLPYTNMHDTFWAVKPQVEAALGLKWGRYVCKGRCHFQLHAAWEELWWPDQNQMRRYLTPSVTDSSGNVVNMPLSISEKGDLGLHGMTFGARLDF